MRNLVTQYVEDVYIEGLQEGGLSPDDMTAADAQNIDRLNARQQDYISGFTLSARLATDEVTKQAILDRIDLWTESIYAAGQSGWTAALQRKKKMVQWHAANDDFMDKEGLCASLNNKIVYAGESFGEGFNGEPIYHEPAHFGCRCTTTEYIP
ncbi:MAG: hypothetical protein WCF84_19065 [Anaerolineae bacterium]